MSDLTLILASLGTTAGAAALLRRRVRRARAPWPSFAGAGARQLADALCAAAAEPLPVAGPSWKSLAETIELQAWAGLTEPGTDRRAGVRVVRPVRWRTVS